MGRSRGIRRDRNRLSYTLAVSNFGRGGAAALLQLERLGGPVQLHGHSF